MLHNTGDTGLLVQASGTGSWSNVIRAADNTGKLYYSVDGHGTTYQAGNAFVTGNLYISGTVQGATTKISSIVNPRVVAPSDCGTTLRTTADVPVKLSIPAGLQVGCRVGIIQAGKGTVVIAGAGPMRSEHLGGGAPVQSTIGRYAEASTLIDSASSFLLRGDLSDADAAGPAMASSASTKMVLPVSYVSTRS